MTAIRNRLRLKAVPSLLYRRPDLELSVLTRGVVACHAPLLLISMAHSSV